MYNRRTRWSWRKRYLDPHSNPNSPLNINLMMFHALHTGNQKRFDCDVDYKPLPVALGKKTYRKLTLLIVVSN